MADDNQGITLATLGGVTHKGWYLRGAESFVFSQQFAQNLKKVVQ